MTRHQQIQIRVRIVMVALGLVFLVLIARAADLQLFKGDVLRELADRQQHRTLKTLPHRGEIVDRAGEELAVSLLVDSAFANPSEIENPRATARAIASITKQSISKLDGLLRRRGSFVWVSRQLEPAAAEALRKMQLPGIGFVKESKRYYPNGALMGQAIGFVGLDALGLEGLEKSYDKYIRGASEVVELRRDALNRGIRTDGFGTEPSSGGYRVELTIDKAISYEAQKSLDATVAKYKALNGVAIAQDVDTGAILAMVTSPPFDPNKFSKYPAGFNRNRAVADLYEPGSTLKTFLLAAALQENVVKLDTLIFCENGKFQVADRTIRDTHEYAWLTASEVVKYSSNIGALKMGKMLGRGNLHHYLDAFGFNDTTGIDLPGEARSIFKPLKQWNEVLAATMSYGQGVAVSPIQVITAMSAVANGGRLMKPYLVSRVADAKGKTAYEAEPEVRGNPIRADTAAKMRRVLESVVADDGTGKQARIPGYLVAGKTGTSQKIDPATGAYSRTHYMASFVGFVPSKDPRVAIYVTLNEPQGEIYGGIVAGPVFSAIAAKAMERLHVPPDYPLVGQTPLTIPIPDAVEEDTYAEALTGADGKHFTGMTLREALRAARMENVSLSPKGSGFATREKCKKSSCEVVFQPM